MYAETFSDSFEPIWIYTAGEFHTGVIIHVHLWVATTGVDSSVTITHRWHDGMDDRIRVDVFPLTDPTERLSVVFPVLIGPNQLFTQEAALTGDGTYGVAYGVAQT